MSDDSDNVYKQKFVDAEDTRKRIFEDYFFLSRAPSNDRCPSPSLTDDAERLWAEYLIKEMAVRRPLILMIGGPSVSGKSSLAIELARLFGIRAIVGTDTLRNVLATCCPQSPEILSLFSHECWKVVSADYSSDSLAEGFRRQCRELLPAIRATCLHSTRHVQNTIIEGVHLIPEVISELEGTVQAHIIPLYLSVSRERLEQILIPKRTRSTYMHRQLSDYGLRINKLATLANWWTYELKAHGVDFIENNCDPLSLIDHALSIIYGRISIQQQPPLR